MDWIRLVYDNDKMWVLAYTVMNFLVLQKNSKYFGQLMVYEFLKGTSLPSEIILQAATRVQVLAIVCLIILTWGSGKETTFYIH